MKEGEPISGEIDWLKTRPSTGKDASGCKGDALARRHRPILMMDENEPYQPVAMGYTIFEKKAQSPSSKFQVVPKGGAVIEYAIWYDWDIQHMYDLEHVWVYLGETGTIVELQASRHGKRIAMTPGCDALMLKGDRPQLYCEAGKHAHWASQEEMAKGAGIYLLAMCTDMAGLHGVHRGNVFCRDGHITPSPLAHRLARLKAKADAFVPAFIFSPADDQAVKLVPWQDLERWIPRRVEQLMADLPGQIPHIRAIFFDCGDTIIDEASEEKHEGSEIVTRAAFIPGGDAMVREVKDAGFAIALVADGPRQTFENVLKPDGLWDLFEAHVISEQIGELKPSPKMFAAAVKALGIKPDQIADCVMIGNNLARDIKGANDYGMQSVFMRWSDRRSHRPLDVSMVPDHTIDCPSDFLPLLQLIEEAMATAEKKTRPCPGERRRNWHDPDAFRLFSCCLQCQTGTNRNRMVAFPGQ